MKFSTDKNHNILPSDVDEKVEILIRRRDVHLDQLAEYLDRLSLDSGWLIIFSRNDVSDWDKVGERELVKENNKKIEVIRL